MGAMILTGRRRVQDAPRGEAAWNPRSVANDDGGARTGRAPPTPSLATLLPMTERKSIHLLPVVIVLAVLGLVVGARFFLAWVAPAGDQEGLARAEAPAARGVDDAPLSPAAGGTLAGADEPGAEARLDLVEEERLRLQADLPVIEGRTAFDHGLPADEELFVVELGEPSGVRGILGGDRVASRIWGEERGREGEVEAGRPTFVRVAEDGSFRVPLREPGARVGHLALVGRYTYSLRTKEVSVDDRDVVLSGELGAWIVGSLRAPGVAEGDERLAGVEVEMGPDVTASFETYGLSGIAYDADTETDADGVFEFRGVSDDFARGIFVQPEGFAPQLELGLRPRAGERVELSLELQRGATLRGTVLGPDGAPLVGVPVAATVVGALGRGLGDVQEGETDADGRFELQHVLTGRRLEVHARPEEHRHAKLATEAKLRDGQVLDGLVLACEAGLEVAGRVLFTDGAPAADVEVILGLDVASMDPSMMGLAMADWSDRKVRTEEDGTFRFAGLSARSYQVWAVTEREEGIAASVARRTGVAAGTTGLVLELEATCGLAGRLSTASQREIGAFSVDLVLEGSGGVMGIGAVRRSRAFDGPQDGGFLMEGLPAGAWEVTVRARGFAATLPRVVTLPVPEGAPPEDFELVPAASISGRVLDVGGTPVSGATVSLELDVGERIQQSMTGGGPTAVSDHLGEYLLEGIEPGAISVVARLQGFAGSEPASLDLAVGELREDLDLTLRLGGTVEGEVLDEAGDPAAGRMVIVQSMPDYSRQHIATAGPDGDFRFEHLEPGSWQVISMANALTGDVGTGEAEGMGDMLKDMKMDVVDVRDGGEHWVTLGRPAQDPVEVLGSVRAGDEPVAGAVVSFVPEESRGIADMRMTTTDENGDFALELERRGAHLVTVQAGVQMGRQTSVEFDEVVPEEVAQHRVQLRMPLGGIRGRILGPDGEPAGGARVTLHVDDGIRFGTFMGGNYVEGVAGPDGRYELEYLRPGRYAVSAGGASLGGTFGDRPTVGREVRSGLVVDRGEWLDGVDFRLSAPRELSGRVLGLDGNPVAGAAVFVRDEAGQLLDHFSFTTTDGAGRFVYRGVAEGTYTVMARKGERVSPSSAPVRVREGSRDTAEARLEEGTVLLVKVVDRSGTEFRARVSVVDDAGAEMCGMLTVEEVMQQFGKGFSSTEQRVGPLPPGRYRVTATLDDGRTADKGVTLAGQTERRVMLRVR